MADETDNIKEEFKSAAEEVAAIFGETLASISAVYSQKLREESNQLSDLGKTLLGNFKNDLTSLGKSSSTLLDIQSKLLNGSLKQQDITKAIQAIDIKTNKVINDRNILEKAGIELTNRQKEDYTIALALAEDQKKAIKAQGDLQNKINKELGIAGSAMKIVGGIFKQISGTNPFENVVSEVAAATAQLALNNEELKKGKNLTAERVKELKDQNETLKSQTTVRGNISKKIKESLTTTNLMQVAGAAILKGALATNKAQTEFRQLTGESAENFTSFNTSLISSVDQIKTLSALTKQFGFNANVAFDQINIQEAAELEVLMGLSAEEAGLLAFNAQISGENLKDGADNAVKGINPLFSQKQILSEISKLAPAITLAFGNSNEELAKAASKAKELGLNLSQVDKIADGLLNIESSIAAEFEAEVMTGKQLNFERARSLALNNDILGLTAEIASNTELTTAFSSGNRLQQEAIAAAIGLGKDELATMVQEQALLSEMSAEEIEAKEAADLKRLSVQESLNKSIEKMTQALAGPVEAFASLLDNAFVLKGLMVAIGIVTTASFAKSLGSALFSMVAMIPKAAALLGLETGKAVAALTTASAMTLGLGAIGILAAVAAGSMLIKSMVGSAQNVQDGMAPASKGPFTITDSFGATAITAKGDGLAVSPNIKREGRDGGGGDLDYDKLANAIAKGAEAGTSRAKVTANVDNSRFFANGQVASNIEKRKFSY